MLLGCRVREGLKPVRAMRHAKAHGPFLHAVGHNVGSGTVQRSAVVYHVKHLLVCIARKILLHLLLIEYILAEKL